MKIQALLFTAALAAASLFSSCSKNDDNNNSGGSGNLTPGKGMITFNSSSNFGGSTTFNPSSPQQAVAVRASSGAGYDNITITVTDVNISTISSRTAQLIILVNKSLTGSQNANFANTSSDAIYPTLVISSTANGAVGDQYASETGAVTITKLSATEIEGTFSGKLVNDDNGTSITVNNGTFAGKF